MRSPTRSPRPTRPPASCSARPARRLVGRAFPDVFDPADAQAVRDLLAGVRASGRADDVRARIAERRARGARLRLAVPPGKRRAVPGPPGRHPAGATAAEPAELPRVKSKLLKLVENAPRRLRRHRPRRAHPRRQRRLPRHGPARHRGTGARRAAGALARPARRRDGRADRQSAPARLGAAVRHHAARRVRRHRRGRDLRRRR